MPSTRPESPTADNTKPASQRGIRIVVGALILAASAIAGYWYWHYSSLHPSTNDAYTGAHVVRLAAMASGRVASVNAQSYTRVKAGDVLITLDATPFDAALESARAARDMALQQIGANTASVDIAEAELKARQADLVNTRKQTARTLDLAAKKLVSQQSADQARAALDSARDAVSAAQAKVQQTLAQLGQGGNGNAALRAANAKVAQAQYDLANTVVHAPVDGLLGEVRVRKGDWMSVGERLIPLIETGQFWVDANFKETDLLRIQSGQTASITIDMYPGQTFQGRVSKLSPASGAAFALLPPENATGNWVKVTQRFPVRVLIDLAPDHAPLRIGASATVTIDAAGNRDNQHD